MRGLLPSLIVLLCMQYATAQWFKFVLSKGMTCEDRCKKRTKMCNPLDEFRDCKCFPRQMVDNGLQLPIDPYLVCRMNWAGVVPKCCDLYKQQDDSNKNCYSQSETSSIISNQSHVIDQLTTRLASCDQDAEAGTSNMTAEMFTLLVEQNVKQNQKLEQLEKRLDNQREEIVQLETSLGNQRDELETKLGNQREEIGQLETKLGNQHEEIGQLETKLGNQHEEIEQLKDGLSSEKTESFRLANLTAKMVNSLGEQNQDIEALTQAWSTEPWKQLAESVSASGSIGFTASLGRPEVEFPYWITIKFDKVLTNEGNGYDPSTGYFTVPVAGTYLFIFKIYGTANGQHSTGILKVNGRHEVSSIMANQMEMDGSSVFLRLNKGDRVNIDAFGTLRGYYTHNLNTFTGFLVHK